MWLIVLPLGVTAPWRDREAPAGLRSSRAPHPGPASCTAIFKPGAGKATCRHLSSARPTPFLTLTLLWENTNPLPSPAASRVTDPHPSRGPSRDPRSPRPSPGSRDACSKVDAAAAGREAEGGRLARRGPCPRGCPAEDRRAAGQRRPLRGAPCYLSGRIHFALTPVGVTLSAIGSKRAVGIVTVPFQIK